MGKSLKFYIFLLPLYLATIGKLQAQENASLLRVGVLGGFTSTQYALYGKGARSTSSYNGVGQIYGGVIDFGRVAGVESGWYLAKRNFRMEVSGVKTRYDFTSYEIPFMFRLRFRYFQWGLGLLYRRMEDRVDVSTQGVNFASNLNDTGFKRDDLAGTMKFGMAIPLGLFSLTGELRGFYGFTDIALDGHLTTVHSVGADFLAGILF